MQTFIMLTRLTPGSLRSPRSLVEVERQTVDHIRADCPDVEWVGSYAVLSSAMTSTSSGPPTAIPPQKYPRSFAVTDMATPRSGRHISLIYRSDSAFG
jgi:hypothetical protein